MEDLQVSTTKHSWCGRVAGTATTLKWHAILTLDRNNVHVLVTDMNETLTGGLSLNDIKNNENENEIAEMEKDQKLLIIKSMIEKSDMDTDKMRVRDGGNGERQLRISSGWSFKIDGDGDDDGYSDGDGDGDEDEDNLGIDLDILSIRLGNNEEEENKEVFMKALFDGLHETKERIKQVEKEKYEIEREIKDMEEAEKVLDRSFQKRDQHKLVFLQALNNYKRNRITAMDLSSE